MGRSLTATYTTGSLANEARLRPLRSITGREHVRTFAAAPTVGRAGRAARLRGAFSLALFEDIRGDPNPHDQCLEE